MRHGDDRPLVVLGVLSVIGGGLNLASFAGGSHLLAICSSPYWPRRLHSRTAGASHVNDRVAADRRCHHCRSRRPPLRHPFNAGRPVPLPSDALAERGWVGSWRTVLSGRDLRSCFRSPHWSGSPTAHFCQASTSFSSIVWLLAAPRASAQGLGWLGSRLQMVSRILRRLFVVGAVIILRTLAR